ncbi:hypothetical protein [Helicobacter labetoulli]|uniref:hypothetical protein n=1 Tax=Helicobacter labetoulli TaxID=2315333 RepID=UPI000EF6D046|nr:hypothetical protein [Helicobacter labetoulli]
MKPFQNTFQEKMANFSLKWQLWILRKAFQPEDPYKEQKLEAFMHKTFGITERITYFACGLFIGIPDPRTFLVALVSIAILFIIMQGIKTRKEMLARMSAQANVAPQQAQPQPQAQMQAQAQQQELNPKPKQNKANSFVESCH